MANNRPQNTNKPLSGGNFPLQPGGMPLTYAMMPQPNVSILSNQSVARGVYQPQMQNVYVRNMGTPGAVYARPPQQVTPEEHRRLEEQARKDWNFQLQQRRLRAFSTSSGQKMTATPDSLIKNIFDTYESIHPKPKTAVVNNIPSQVPASVARKLEPAAPLPTIEKGPPPPVLEEQANTIPSTAPAHTSPESQRKNLEEMMMKYTDMSKPSRAHTFPKATSKETKPPKTTRTTNFQLTPKTSPEMANDFFTSAIRGSGRKHSFIQKGKVLHATRLPPWCFVENKIPELYRTVLQTVTHNGTLDTSLLYPILVSSGLHHDALGHIWGLVNLTTPGQLMPHELNAALALVALAQNGCKFSGLEVLHSVPQPPIPFLQHPSLCPSPASQREGSKNSPTLKSPTASISSQPNLSPELPKEPIVEPEQTEEFADFLSAPPPPPVAPAESPMKNLTCGSSAVGSRLASYNTSTIQPKLGSDTSTTVQSSISSKVELHDDDFADFQHAENLTSDGCRELNLSAGISLEQNAASEQNLPLDHSTNQDTRPNHSASNTVQLNNFVQQTAVPEVDRYAVFRELEITRDDAQEGSSHADESFALGKIATDVQKSSEEKKCNSERWAEQDINSTFNNVGKPVHVVSTDDEFGEFLSVAAPSDSVNIASSVNTVSTCTSSVHNSSLSNPLVSITSVSAAWTASHMDAAGDSAYQSVISPEFQLLQFQSAKSGLHNTSGPLGSVFSSNTPEPTDADEFGDFMSPGDFPVDGDSSSLNNQSLFSKDTGSAESQSISSFELCATDGFAVGSELSRHGSVPSLDLKVTPETDEDFGDMQSSYVPPTCNGYLGSKPNDACTTSNSPNGESKSKTVFPIVDRYSFVHSDATTQSDLEKNVNEWEHCLESCCQLIQGANDVFSNISCSTVCKEVLNSEEGKDYLKNIVEVYKLVHRVRLSIKTMAFETEAILKLLHQIDLVWSNFSIFISASPHMPDLETLDYSRNILKPEPENNFRACGVCLLDVGDSSLTQASESNTLLYGGRQYHATCANFWVNCVNSLLPALKLQQLL